MDGTLGAQVPLGHRVARPSKGRTRERVEVHLPTLTPAAASRPRGQHCMVLVGTARRLSFVQVGRMEETSGRWRRERRTAELPTRWQRCVDVVDAGVDDGVDGVDFGVAGDSDECALV